MRIVFLGTGEIGVPSLIALTQSAAHEVCAVYTQPDRPAGRDLKLRPSPIKLAAQEICLPVFQPPKIRAPQAVEELKALQPELIVVVAYGQILPRNVLEIPPRGCLNIHASLLPRHRGASPINAAILAGDSEAGITIMQMDEGLDTGDMLLKRSVAIEASDTAGILHDRLAALAPAALLETLEKIPAGTIAREKQDDSQATYAPKLSRENGAIDWRLPAVEIDRQIRGLTPWPGVFTLLPDGMVLKIHDAVVREDAGGTEAGVVLGVEEEGLRVATGEGAILLREVQLAGKRRMKATEFLRGRPLVRGEKLVSS